MNDKHLELCSSERWAEGLRTHLMDWVARQPSLGDNLIEVGPGPGLTTDLLRQLSARVTAVEADDYLAGKLAARMEGTNVEVIHADATALLHLDKRRRFARTRLP